MLGYILCGIATLLFIDELKGDKDDEGTSKNGNHRSFGDNSRGKYKNDPGCSRTRSVRGKNVKKKKSQKEKEKDKKEKKQPENSNNNKEVKTDDKKKEVKEKKKK